MINVLIISTSLSHIFLALSILKTYTCWKLLVFMSYRGEATEISLRDLKPACEYHVK